VDPLQISLITSDLRSIPDDLIHVEDSKLMSRYAEFKFKGFAVYFNSKAPKVSQAVGTVQPVLNHLPNDGTL